MCNNKTTREEIIRDMKRCVKGNFEECKKCSFHKIQYGENCITTMIQAALDMLEEDALKDKQKKSDSIIHAYWIKDINNRYKCSNCGHLTNKFLPGFHPTYLYCYCGAKMDGFIK